MTDSLKDSSSQNGVQLLYRSKSDGLPPGAKWLSPTEVEGLMTKVIDSWQPAKEMWPLKYGHHVLGGLAGVTGAVFITQLRQRMRLFARGRFVSIVPTVYLPGVVTFILHEALVSRRLLNPDGKAPVCPVCIELRSITLQILTGAVQPLFLSILASSALAKTTASYPLPPISQWQSLLKTYGVLLRPMRATFFAAVIANGINAAVITHSQGKAALRVQQKLTESDFFLG